MRNHKGTVLLVLLTAAMVVTTATATLHQTGQEAGAKRRPREDEAQKRKLEQEKRFPVVNFGEPEPSDPEKRSQRKSKNKRYDKFGFAIKDLSPEVGEESYESEWSLHTDALPVGQSSAVVVGEVLNAEAHLSNDKSGIYSEFAVRVEEVLKNDGSLHQGSLVTVDRAGGFVSYSNGHKRLYRVVGQNMPHVGLRYVLFLATSGESPNYHIITGYELGGGGVSPLDESGRMDAYRGVDAKSFMKAVSDALSQAETAP